MGARPGAPGLAPMAQPPAGHHYATICRAGSNKRVAASSRSSAADATASTQLICRAFLLRSRSAHVEDTLLVVSVKRWKSLNATSGA
jgi:hypothetical protein